MKNTILKLAEIMSKGDVFLIFLISLMLVIILVVIYLIKLELTSEEDEKQEELYLNIEKDTIKPIISENAKEEKNIPFMEEIKNSEIEDYEDEMESKAIISTSELEDRISKMEETGEMDLHQKEIERYENEMEEKAIISYEELVKRAGTGVINYESEENYGGIRVGKVDTSKTDNVILEDNMYSKEELFLRGLKEFRSSL